VMWALFAAEIIWAVLQYRAISLK